MSDNTLVSLYYSQRSTILLILFRKVRILESKCTYNSLQSLFLAVPAPVSVMVRSNESNPIRPIASDVSLQCDVALRSLGSDIPWPVAINMIWIGPNSMVPIMTNQTLLSRGMRNASAMITLHSFGRSDSGNYSCAAFLTSSSLLLNTSQSLSSTTVVTTGMEKSFNNQQHS